jgi:predicted transcriptional regulator
MDRLERPDLYVMVRLLETLRISERTLTRTQLQISSGMNYSQFARYLDLALSRGLVALVDGGRGPPNVELTAKGYEALMFLARGIKEVIGTGLEGER